MHGHHGVEVHGLLIRVFLAWRLQGFRVVGCDGPGTAWHLSGPAWCTRSDLSLYPSIDPETSTHGALLRVGANSGRGLTTTSCRDEG